MIDPLCHPVGPIFLINDHIDYIHAYPNVAAWQNHTKFVAIYKAHDKDGHGTGVFGKVMFWEEFMTDSPTSQPTINTDSPTTLTVAPTAITHQPTVTTLYPTTNTHSPTQAITSPTAITIAPTTATDQPTSSTLYPTANTMHPTSITFFLPTLTVAPTATTHQPTLSSTGTGTMKLNNGRIWFIAGITLSSIGSLCLSLACCLYAKRKNKATYDENNIIIDTTQIDDIEEGDIIGTTNAIELQTTTEGAPTSTI